MIRNANNVIKLSTEAGKFPRLAFKDLKYFCIRHQFEEHFPMVLHLSQYQQVHRENIFAVPHQNHEKTILLLSCWHGVKRHFLYAGLEMFIFRIWNLFCICQIALTPLRNIGSLPQRKHYSKRITWTGFSAVKNHFTFFTFTRVMPKQCKAMRLCHHPLHQSQSCLFPQHSFWTVNCLTGVSPYSSNVSCFHWWTCNSIQLS